MNLGVFVEDVLETLILDQDGLRKILKNDKLKFILQLQNLQPQKALLHKPTDKVLFGNIIRK